MHISDSYPKGNNVWYMQYVQPMSSPFACSPGRSILEHTDETEGVGKLTGVPSHVDKRGNDTSAPPANFKSTTSMPQLIEPSEGRWHDFQTFNTCKLARLGGREKDGYGAWVACVNLVPTGGGLAYSFGVGGDVSYDNDLVERGLTVRGVAT